MKRIIIIIIIFSSVALVIPCSCLLGYLVTQQEKGGDIVSTPCAAGTWNMFPDPDNIHSVTANKTAWKKIRCHIGRTKPVSNLLTQPWENIWVLGNNEK